jgi:hypothetical protein
VDFGGFFIFIFLECCCTGLELRLNPFLERDINQSYAEFIMGCAYLYARASWLYSILSTQTTILGAIYPPPTMCLLFRRSSLPMCVQ